MKQGRQTSTKPFNGIFRAGRRQRLDRLACTALAAAIGMGLSTTAVAQTAGVHPSVHDGYKPAVVEAANGTPVVNIVAPDKRGLSHNVYSRFNVGKDGLILNNSAAISKTQLAGYVYGNKHLKASGPASVILNEVTSTNPSVLQGYMEVAGTPAAVIVANPNGISCDGCGFLNTPRAVLTTGTPMIGEDGSLNGFRVRRGSINIRGAGLDASHIDRVDLLSRAITLNGKIWAHRLNVVVGANRIDYGDLTATVIDVAGSKPEVNIDVAALGGMYAGVIRLVGTEAGVGVNIQGEVAAQAGDFTLTSAGKVVLDGKATATGSVTVGSLRSVAVNGVLASGDDMHVQGHDLGLAGTVYSVKDIALAADGDIRNQGQVQAGRRLDVTAHDLTNSGKLYALGDSWQANIAGAFVNAAAGNIYAAGDLNLATGSLAQHGLLEAVQNLAVTTNDALANDGVMQSDAATLTLDGGSIRNAGTLSAAGNMVLHANTTLVNQSAGNVYAQQALTLTADQLTNIGAVASSGDMQVSVDSLDNRGRLQSDAHLALQGAAGIVNTGVAYAARGIDLDAVSLHNAGTLRSAAGLDITIHGDAWNAGSAYAAGNARWQVDGYLANTGVLAAAADVGIEADTLDGMGTLAAGLGDDGKLGARGDLGVHVAQNLQAGGRNLAAGNISLSGGAVDLSGSQTFANDDIQLTARAGDITLRGAQVTAGKMAAFTASGALINGGTTSADGGRISANSLVFEVASLDNRYGHLQQGGSGDLAIHLSGAFDNAHGLLATNADNLSITAASIGNSHGNIQHAGHGLLILQSAGALDNRGGTIDGNGDMAVTLDGALDNGNGHIGMLGDAALHASSLDNGNGVFAAESLLLILSRNLDNSGGTLQSATVLNLQADALANLDAGQIKAQGDDALDIVLTGTLINATDAFIGGSGHVTVQAAQMTNAGQIYAGGDLGVATTDGALDNHGGILQAMGSLMASSASALNNAFGRIESGAGQSSAALHVSADSLDNHGGRLANTGTGITTLAITGDIDNQGGTLGGKGDVTLSADDVDNSREDSKVVATGNLVLKLDMLNNAGGTVYAAQDLTWNRVDASLANTAGASFGAGHDLALTLGAVDNVGGNLDAGRDLALDLATFSGSGRVVVGRNLALALPGDYTNGRGNILKANGDVTLNLGGDFVNPAKAKLLAVGKLTVNAANITNAKNAVINSGHTVLVADGHLANTGDIEGNNIDLTADSLVNTGNIIGGYITAHAGDLVNGRDLGHTIRTSHYATGLIAATRGIDLYAAGTLLNRDAWIFTLGDMRIAADEHGHAAAKVINSSGRISSDGNITIAARSLVNKRRQINISTINDVPVMVGIPGGSYGMRMAMMPPPDRPGDPGHPGGPSLWNTRKTSTSVIPLEQGSPVVKAFCTNLSGRDRCMDPALVTHTDTWVVTSVTRITSASAAGEILAGGDIALNGAVLNDASTIAAGHDLTIDGHGYTGSGSESANFRNVSRASGLTFGHTRKVSMVWENWDGHGAFEDGEYVKYTETFPELDVSDRAPPPNVDWVRLNGKSWEAIRSNTTLSARVTAGNDVRISAASIDNEEVPFDDQPVHGGIALGANGDGRNVGGDPITGAGSVSAGHGNVGDVSIGMAPGTTSGHDGVSTAPPQTVIGPDASITLPQSGLYTVHHDPDSSYLIETDPRFADYAKFISSDYLLDKLGYDPAQADKRLGDGFYEQRRVLDQITTLTGRRYLSSSMDALTQYRALMNNATVAAKKFDFEVGVALTAEQMAALGKDIVWLVKQTVDGQSVLVPVVYLSQAHANQLGQPGAVIAGRNVFLDAGGDITNNGRILASQAASLKANNLLNSGSITAGGNLGIQAAQDILNQGGIIRGADVSLTAGRNVVSSADVGPINLGGVDLGSLDIGSIHASHNLQIAAGRDITLGEVDIHAGHDLQLAAGRDLTATATSLHAGDDLGVLAGRDIVFGATTRQTNQLRGNTFTSTTTHHVTDLKAGGNVRVVAGRDLASQGATLDAGKGLGLVAGRDITLATVTDHKHVDTHGWHGDTRFHKVTDDDTLRATQLHAGQGINVSAGHDVTLVATQITSNQGDVALAVGHDLALAAGHENHTTVVDTYHHDSGFLSSSTTTTHDVTDNTLAVGTHIKGGNVRLAAGHDLTTQGAAVQADKALNLAAGHDIRLGASHDTYRRQHRRHHTESSFSTDLILGVGDGQLYTKTTDDQQGMRVDTIANGTLLSGDTVAAMAGHDITAQGAQIAATHDLAMVAGHDLVIDVAANTYNRKQQHKHRVDGWQRSGLVQMVGTTKTRQRAKGGEVGYTGSVLGSTEGRVRLVAGNDVHITGSDVISQAGTAITGKNVTIDAALGSSDTRNEYSMHRAGVMGGVGGMVGNLANSAVGVYESGKHTGQVKDKRLKALYAAQTAYQAYDLYNNGKAVASKGASGGMGGTGVSLKISLGASTANSHANTHDDIAYGSHIRSQGDITIAATDGDLNVIGSQIQGNNVALAASHDLNLLSQIEQHTQKQSGAHAGGQIGVSIGETTGIFLSLNGGKRRAHGNGTTHAITTVDADGTLSLIAGHDALLKGAQARGQTLLADIGHNLTLVSEQDTGDFASKQWNAGFTLVYGWAKGGVGFSGHASAAGMNNHYKSVTQVTGLAAGDGGFRIHVGGHTDLKGAVIASTADPYKNWLDTGSLTWSDIHNEAKYDSWSFSVGGGAGQSLSGESLGGLTGGLGIPQSHDQSSTTRAGIAKGTITVRNGSQNLAGLDRNPDIDAKGLTREFDRQELAEQQEMGKVAGYVGMRTAGLIAEHEQEKAAADYASAYKRGDQAALKDAKTRMKAWGAGGAYKTILHGMVGAATASLGGGNVLGGALGASAGEAASGAMQQYLVDHGIDPNSTKGKGLMELASTVIGGVAGQGAGAATALQGEKYNRQLHDNEKARIRALAKGNPEEEAKLAAAACFLAHCAAQYPKDSAAYAYFSKVEALGSQLTYEKTLLKQQTDTHYIYLPSLMRFGPQVARRKKTTQLFDYSGTDKFRDETLRFNSTYSLTTRAGGVLQTVGGAASMATGGTAFVVGGAACPESLGAGCLVAAGGAGLAAWGADQTQAGWNTLWTGAPTRTFGGEFVQNALGVSPETAELLYGLAGGVGDLAVAGKTLLGSATDFSRSSALLRASSGKFSPNGITPSGAVMSTPTAKAMVKDIMAGTQGMTKQRAEYFAAQNIKSGSTFPRSVRAAKGTVLYKVVPKGAHVGDKSGFWMTEWQLKALAGKSPAEIADSVGLPAKQAHEMIENGMDVYAITAKRSQTEVFFSEVAKTSQGDVDTQGGAVQTIVPNRSQWSVPEKQNAVDWLGKQQTLSGIKQRSALQAGAGTATATGSRLSHTQMSTTQNCSQVRHEGAATPTCVNTRH